MRRLPLLPMRRLPLLLILGAALPATTAHADFVLVMPEPPQQTLPATPRFDPPAKVETRPLPPAARHSETVHGFGKQIPLRFAVRQIVPPEVRVTYGHGVDPAARVSWHGGGPWRLTLAHAVEPLGWRLIFTPQHCAITR